jgi:type II secretory pathway component PulK
MRGHDQWLRNNGRRGAALIMAIMMLALFSMLGAAYVRYMAIENRQADMILREARADNVALGGFYAAIGVLQKGRLTGEMPKAGGETWSWTFPVYANLNTGDAVRLETHDRRIAEASVTIIDENAKININHVPASVLQAILKVDGAVARNIRGALPLAGRSAGEGAVRETAWFNSIGDLLSRDLLSREAFEAIDASLVTVNSVVDRETPAGFININSAPPEVLAAVLDLPVEAAGRVAARRPFTDLESLSAAARKAPETFNIKPDPEQPGALPPALALESRCFRIISAGRYASLAEEEEYDRASARIEAIVNFDDQGDYRIVRWRVSDNTAAEEEAV